jgi:hypothetical protein
MGKAGRKRKHGKRTPSGRLSRAKPVTPAFDRGTERAQAMQALYGPDGADAIGRAYRAGLLGEGAEAKAMLDTARQIANAYWQAYETGRYQCTLGDKTGGGVATLDHEKAKRREQWLAHVLDFVNHMGRDVRRAFDALVVDVHPDHGPPFLDNLIYAKRRRMPPATADLAQFRRAMDALELLAEGRQIIFAWPAFSC